MSDILELAGTLPKIKIERVFVDGNKVRARFILEKFSPSSDPFWLNEDIFSEYIALCFGFSFEGFTPPDKGYEPLNLSLYTPVVQQDSQIMIDPSRRNELTDIAGVIFDSFEQSDQTDVTTDLNPGNGIFWVYTLKDIVQNHIIENDMQTTLGLAENSTTTTLFELTFDFKNSPSDTGAIFTGHRDFSPAATLKDAFKGVVEGRLLNASSNFQYESMQMITFCQFNAHAGRDLASGGQSELSVFSQIAGPLESLYLLAKTSFDDPDSPGFQPAPNDNVVGNPNIGLGFTVPLNSRGIVSSVMSYDEPSLFTLEDVSRPPGVPVNPPFNPDVFNNNPSSRALYIGQQREYERKLIDSIMFRSGVNIFKNLETSIITSPRDGNLEQETIFQIDLNKLAQKEPFSDFYERIAGRRATTTVDGVRDFEVLPAIAAVGAGRIDTIPGVITLQRDIFKAAFPSISPGPAVNNREEEGLLLQPEISDFKIYRKRLTNLPSDNNSASTKQFQQFDKEGSRELVLHFPGLITGRFSDRQPLGEPSHKTAFDENGTALNALAAVSAPGLKFEDGAYFSYDGVLFYMYQFKPSASFNAEAIIGEGVDSVVLHLGILDQGILNKPGGTRYTYEIEFGFRSATENFLHAATEIFSSRIADLQALLNRFAYDRSFTNGNGFFTSDFKNEADFEDLQSKANSLLSAYVYLLTIAAYYGPEDAASVDLPYTERRVFTFTGDDFSYYVGEFKRNISFLDQFVNKCTDLEAVYLETLRRRNTILFKTTNNVEPFSPGAKTDPSKSKNNPIYYQVSQQLPSGFSIVPVDIGAVLGNFELTDQLNNITGIIQAAPPGEFNFNIQPIDEVPGFGSGDDPFGSGGQ